MTVNAEASAVQVPRVQFLGVATLHAATGAALPLSANDAALLALPCLDASLTRDRIAELLWPDATRPQALRNLRQRRFQLKRLAGVAPLLAVPGELLGSLSFTASEELRDWLDRARGRWRDRRATALRRCAEAHESERALDAALAYRQRLCDDEPLDEDVYADLMRLHYLRADRPALLLVFERLRRRLDQALGQAPSASMQALCERLTQVPVRPANPALPAMILRPPRMVGRDTVSRALQHARSLGSTALVQGEPGMGKTRLLEDFMRGTEGSVVAALRSADRITPYGLMARVARAVADQLSAQVGPHLLPEPSRAVLAAIVPEWGTPAAGPVCGPALQRAMHDWLRLAGIRAVAVDDVHHADPESLALLADWLHRPVAGDAPRPWWLLAARRAEAPPALRDWLATADADALTSVDLPPLAVPDVKELLGLLDLPGLDASAWAEPLWRHSGGNPLFLLETLRALDASGTWGVPNGGGLPLPGRVGELLQRRIATLSGVAARLAAVAAVAGDDLDAELAAAVLDTHPLDLAPAWAELEQAQVLRERAFTHDLLRDAARHSLPAPVAEAMHARVATQLQARGEAVAPERAARHWAAAGRPKEAGAAYVQAARRCRRARRREDEARWWQHAIQALESLAADDPDLLFDAQAESIEPTLLTQGPQAALDVADKLLTCARTDVQRLAVQHSRLQVLMLAGQFSMAADLGGSVVALAAQVGDANLGVRAELFLAQAQGQAGLAGPALALARLVGCSGTVQALADDELSYEFLMAQAYLLRLLGRHRDSVAVLDRAVPLAESLGDPQELLTVLSNRALAHYELGRAAASHADAARAHALHARLGDVTSVAAGVCSVHLGAAAASLGRHTQALAMYQSARDTFAAAGGGAMWPLLADLQQATLLVHLGQFARAGQLLAGDWQAAALDHRLRRHLLLARLARWQGQAAERHVEAARQAAEAVRPALAATAAALVLIEASHAMPAAQAASALEAAVADAALSEDAPVALLARSRLAECLIETDPATAHAQAVQCWAESADCQVHDSMTTFWHALARVFRAGGDVPAFEAVIATATAWLREVAVPNTPEPFRPSFVERNPAVRDLVSWAKSHR
jgi:DNA-binding SARP family transcriptional activator/tetratricopeptide (TPR) repeat protein